MKISKFYFYLAWFESILFANKNLEIGHKLYCSSVNIRFLTWLLYVQVYVPFSDEN